MKRIGLIAGWGRFPIVVAQSLKQQGYHVACVALKDHADPVLENICDQLRWTSVAKVGHAIRFCQRCGASQAILAGKVFKLRLFQPGAIFKLMPDCERLAFFGRTSSPPAATVKTTRCSPLSSQRLPKTASKFALPLISFRSYS